MNMTREDKAKLALGSLMDSCELLAALSKGAEHTKEYDAYFVPETFWYHRVHLHHASRDGLKETIDQIASRVQEGTLPPLLSWCDYDFDKKEISRILLRAGYVPIVTQKAMYMSLEGRIPGEVQPQVEMVCPEDVGIWSEMSAEAFNKPPETEGLLLLSDHKDCDFLTWKEDGEMVGGTLLICKNKNAGIHEVSTMPKHRRKGVGAALVGRGLDIAVEKGCTYATLQASEMGFSMYQKLGMEDVGEIHSWLMPRE